MGLMHLNGLGAVRDCGVATALLKRVCEKGAFVTRNLQKVKKKKYKRYKRKTR